MRQRTLLIADDEADLLLSLELHFAMNGYRTLAAADGKAALELFGRENPDVVLMDVQMPELDGVSALREMLEINPDARIFVMSGVVGEKRARMLIAEGARGFLPKPLDMKDMGQKIDAAYFANA